jgi:pimeloyl-ACP methyl ester carboxylesterase
VDLRAEGRRLTAAVTGGLLPEDAVVRAGGLDLHCLVWGRAADPTAVLVHGNGGHAHWWDALVPALVPGWRLVALDLRGHGESAWPDAPAYGMDDFAADLAAVLDALAPGPVALVGHSMGGRVAAWLAATAPARVRGLVLADTRLGAVDPALAARWRGRIAGLRTGRTYPSYRDAVAAFRFIPGEERVPGDVLADLAHHAVVEREPGAWSYRFDRAALSVYGDGAGDLLPVLGRVRCPTAVFAGESSWVMDAAHRTTIVETLPDAAMHVFPGGHHFVAAGDPTVSRMLRRFLDALPPAA